MTLSIDLIIVIACLAFFIIGFNRGFWRAIIGPFALILGAIAGYIYYQKTGEWITSFLISFFGPFLIKLTLGFVLLLFPKDKNAQEDPVTLGKFAGGIFNLVWGGAIIMIALLLITLVPSPWSWLKTLQNQITDSQAYGIMNTLTRNTIENNETDILQMMNFWENPEKIENLQTTPEYQNLMTEDKITTILEDETLMDDIQNKNFVKILGSTKIQDLIKDKDLMSKLFNLQKMMIETTDQDSVNNEHSGPRIINIDAPQL